MRSREIKALFNELLAREAKAKKASKKKTAFKRRRGGYLYKRVSNFPYDLNTHSLALEAMLIKEDNEVHEEYGKRNLDHLQRKAFSRIFLIRSTLKQIGDIKTSLKDVVNFKINGHTLECDIESKKDDGYGCYCDDEEILEIKRDIRFYFIAIMHSLAYLNKPKLVELIHNYASGFR